MPVIRKFAWLLLLTKSMPLTDQCWHMPGLIQRITMPYRVSAEYSQNGTSNKIWTFVQNHMELVPYLLKEAPGKKYFSSTVSKKQF